jgi:hypothetical protein
MFTTGLQAIGEPRGNDAAWDKNEIAVSIILGVQLRYHGTVGICGGQSGVGSVFFSQFFSSALSITLATFHTHDLILSLNKHF